MNTEDRLWYMMKEKTISPPGHQVSDKTFALSFDFSRMFKEVSEILIIKEYKKDLNSFRTIAELSMWTLIMDKKSLLLVGRFKWCYTVENCQRIAIKQLVEEDPWLTTVLGKTTSVVSYCCGKIFESIEQDTDANYCLYSFSTDMKRVFMTAFVTVLLLFSFLLFRPKKNISFYFFLEFSICLPVTFLESYSPKKVP